MPGMVQSVERAAAILRVLAHGGRPLSLAEVAAALDLAKGTVHGLLRTLKRSSASSSRRARPAATCWHRSRWTTPDPASTRTSCGPGR